VSEADCNVSTGVVPSLTALLGNPLESYPLDTSWYDYWVRYQLDHQPHDLYSILYEAETDQEDIPSETFKAVWNEVRLQASTSDSSIESIVTQLQAKDLIRMDNDTDALSLARNLVFAIIGWQTMLYKPDMGSCSPDQLAIVDETDGHRGFAYMDLRQGQRASRKVLHEFFMGFGVLLPSSNFDALPSDDENLKRASLKTKSLSPKLMNAQLLVGVGSIQLKWTDSLACHLEFDPNANTLYLFRFPTFCAIHLVGKEKDETASTLHSCAAPLNTTSYWAATDDVNDLLRETLLSYRLLFGQEKASRQLFRSLDPFKDLPAECKDNGLMRMCGRKQHNLMDGLQELDSYVLSRDFPILQSRLALLNHYFSNKLPRTWKELWNDKRDSASWFTFWAVLIIGGIGILLALLQVILQIVQVNLQLKGS
jgi:hypothetical protein